MYRTTICNVPDKKQNIGSHKSLRNIEKLQPCSLQAQDEQSFLCTQQCMSQTSQCQCVTLKSWQHLDICPQLYEIHKGSTTQICWTSENLSRNSTMDITMSGLPVSEVGVAGNARRGWGTGPAEVILAIRPDCGSSGKPCWVPQSRGPPVRQPQVQAIDRGARAFVQAPLLYPAAPHLPLVPLHAACSQSWHRSGHHRSSKDSVSSWSFRGCWAWGFGKCICWPKEFLSTPCSEHFPSRGCDGQGRVDSSVAGLHPRRARPWRGRARQPGAGAGACRRSRSPAASLDCSHDRCVRGPQSTCAAREAYGCSSCCSTRGHSDGNGGGELWSRTWSGNASNRRSLGRVSTEARPNGKDWALRDPLWRFGGRSWTWPASSGQLSLHVVHTRVRETHALHSTNSKHANTLRTHARTTHPFSAEKRHLRSFWVSRFAV